jgi:hypothetical protein
MRSTQLDTNMQSLNLFFIWCVEDISKQRSIKDDNEVISGYETHNNIRLYLHYFIISVTGSNRQ